MLILRVRGVKKTGFKREYFHGSKVIKKKQLLLANNMKNMRKSENHK
jgi:hypothetical protein